MTFRMDNTEGFTQAELDTLNSALHDLLSRHIDDDTSDSDVRNIEKGLSDRINNAWTSGMTTAELVTAVERGAQ